MLRLKIRFWPALLVLVVVAVTTRLGFWQLSRAHQKEALAANFARFDQVSPVKLDGTPIALAEIEYHRVVARGRFMPEYVVYLDNRPQHGIPGFHVVMPFALSGGGYVLVERGWLPRNAMQRTALAPYDTPSGEVEIEGRARAHTTRLFELGQSGPETHAKIRQNLEIEKYQAEIALPLQPFVIQQTSNPRNRCIPTVARHADADSTPVRQGGITPLRGGCSGSLNDHLARDWPIATDGAERNYGYMVQWWALAAAALIFGLYCAMRK